MKAIRRFVGRRRKNPWYRMRDKSLVSSWEGGVIRAGTLADVAQLQAVQVRAGSLFRNAGMQTVADNPPTDASTFGQSISDGLLRVASRDHDLAGFTLALETGSDCHLEQMSVDPAFGRRGIGSELLRHLIILATARKLARVTLSTFTHLAWNGPFYERFGFARVADSDLTPALVEARKQEAAAGLDMTVRAIMSLQLRTERT